MFAASVAGFAPETVSEARTLFSKAVRATDHDAATLVIWRTMRVRQDPQWDAVWANFAYRCLRTVSPHLPDAERHALLLAYIDRFDNQPEMATIAISILQRTASAETILGFFADTPHSQIPAWVGGLHATMRQQLTRDFYRTSRNADWAMAAEILGKSLTQACPEEEEAWANFLLRCLRTVSPHLPDAERHALLLAYIDRFDNQPEMATIAISILQRTASAETILGFFADTPHSQIPAWVGGLHATMRQQLTRDFYRTSRNADWAMAAEILGKSLTQACPEEEEAWANFLLRCLRTVSPHLPDAERHALLLAYIDRFDNQPEMAGKAILIAKRQDGAKWVLDHFHARVGDPPDEAAQRRYDWAAALLAPDLGEWTAELYTAIRSEDGAALVTVLKRAMETTSAPVQSDAEWGAFVLRGLRAVSRLALQALTDLRLQFLERFLNEASLIEPVVRVVLREQGINQISAWITQSGCADLALVLSARVLRRDAALPPDSPGLVPVVQEAAEATSLVVRAAAVRLAGQPMPSPEGIVIFLGQGLTQATADACALAFSDPGSQVSFLFEDLDDMMRHRDRLVALTGLHSDNFVALSKFDLRTDNDIYHHAEDLVDQLFDAVLALPDYMSLPKVFLRTQGNIRDGVVDRIASQVRRLESVRSARPLAGDAGTHRLIICPAKRRDVSLAYDLAETCAGTEIVLAVPPPMTGGRTLALDDPMSATEMPSVKRVRQALKSDTVSDAMRLAAGQDTVFFMQLSDRQYLQTAMALADYREEPVFILSPTPPHAVLELRAADGNPANLIMCQLSALSVSTEEDADFQNLANAFDVAIANLRCQDDSPLAQGCRGFLLWFAQVVMSVSGLALSYAGFFETLFATPGLRVFVVSPGRTFQAQIGVALARAAGIATVDLQDVAISRLRRFRAPVADLATCIDRAQWEIYRHHYGMPKARISVTGSARIDALVQPVRHMDRAVAHRSVFGTEYDLPVLFMCTQPIEADRMVAIVEIAMTASNYGWRVILKPHHNERDHHLATYHALQQRAARPDLVVIDRSLDVYQLLQASDVVATYYSTVAQETFALGGRVVVIDPFEAPPDLDYVSIGLATRVRHEGELQEVLSRCDPALGAATDPYLSVLQDGMAAQRVWHTITKGVALDPAKGR